TGCPRSARIRKRPADMAHANAGGVSTPARWQFGLGWMGGPHGRRRGGGVAPMPIRKPDAPVVSDPAAAAHGVVARKRLNVSNLPTIASIDLIEDRSPHPGPRRCERSD